jgi:hypothetical protein
MCPAPCLRRFDRSRSHYSLGPRVCAGGPRLEGKCRRNDCRNVSFVLSGRLSRYTGDPVRSRRSIPWLYKNQFNGADRLQAYHQASVKLEWSFRMSDTSYGGRYLRSYGGRYLRDAGLADANERPVSLVRIVVLVAVALPVFGGFYYALLDYLLFG